MILNVLFQNISAHLTIATIFSPFLPPLCSPATAPCSSLPGSIRHERIEEEPGPFPHSCAMLVTDLILGASEAPSLSMGTRAL